MASGALADSRSASFASNADIQLLRWHLLHQANLNHHTARGMSPAMSSRASFSRSGGAAEVLPRLGSQIRMGGSFVRRSIATERTTGNASSVSRLAFAYENASGSHGRPYSSLDVPASGSFTRNGLLLESMVGSMSRNSFAADSVPRFGSFAAHHRSSTPFAAIAEGSKEAEGNSGVSGASQGMANSGNATPRHTGDATTPAQVRADLICVIADANPVHGASSKHTFCPGAPMATSTLSLAVGALLPARELRAACRPQDPTTPAAPSPLRAARKSSRFSNFAAQFASRLGSSACPNSVHGGHRSNSNSWTRCLTPPGSQDVNTVDDAHGARQGLLVAAGQPRSVHMLDSVFESERPGSTEMQARTDRGTPTDAGTRAPEVAERPHASRAAVRGSARRERPHAAECLPWYKRGAYRTRELSSRLLSTVHSGASPEKEAAPIRGGAGLFSGRGTNISALSSLQAAPGTGEAQQSDSCNRVSAPCGDAAAPVRPSLHIAFRSASTRSSSAHTPALPRSEAPSPLHHHAQSGAATGEDKAERLREQGALVFADRAGEPMVMGSGSLAYPGVR
jgi:hypothetical protein